MTRAEDQPDDGKRSIRTRPKIDLARALVFLKEARRAEAEAEDEVLAAMRALMKLDGMTQRQFGELIGYSAPYINDMTSGRRNAVPREMLRRLLRVFPDLADE